jgi:hypothetical protein
MQALLSATVMRVSECQNLGIDTADMRRLITEAKERLRAGDLGAAMVTFTQCDALARAARVLQRETYDAISETARLARESGRAGADTAAFMEALLRAKSAYAHASFAEARAIADRVRADLEQLQA